MANEYVTRTAFKKTITLTAETFLDDDADAALEAASRAIDRHCNRRFWADADALQVRYYQPIDDTLVRTDDLVTLTTLEHDRDADGTFEELWTVGTDFLLSPYNAPADIEPYTLIERHPRGMRYTFNHFYPRTVKITGKFGWPAVPPAVKQATTILASRFMQRARETPLGVIGVGFDGQSIRIAKSDPDVAMLLDGLVRIKVGF